MRNPNTSSFVQNLVAWAIIVVIMAIVLAIAVKIFLWVLTW